MLAAEIDFFKRHETKRVAVFYVVMKVLGIVSEKLRVGQSQKRRYISHILRCCGAWSSLILISVLNREKEAMARDSSPTGIKVDRHCPFMSGVS
jgi:hypothetical protein